MKKTGLIFLLICSMSVTYSLNMDSVKRKDTIIVKTIDSSDLKNQLIKNEELGNDSQKNEEWFMYGFLLVGAFFVYLKFRNNQ